MVREFKLPDVGEGVAEGEIVQWLVGPGDPVSEDQPVAEVETDKAVVEVPSPVNGTVKELRAEAGDVVPVGEVIIVFDVPDEGSESGASRTESDSVEGEEAEETGEEATPEPAAGGEPAEDPAAPSTNGESGGRVFAAPSARRLARELGVDLAAVDGSGPGGRITEMDVHTAAETDADGPEEAEPTAGADGTATGADETGEEAEAAIAEAEEPLGGAQPTVAEGSQPTTEGAAAPAAEPADRDRTLATPATRGVAKELDVDINAVPATEERDGEAVVTDDAVRQYAESQRAAQAADAEAVSAGGEREEGTAAESERPEVAAGTEERLPYRGVRRTIGQQMERSKFTAPHVTHHDQVDVTRLVEARDGLAERAEDRGIKLTYLPFVVKAVVAALREYPILNSQLDEESEEIVKRGDYNIGIATATDAGLMVPVVEDAGRKSLLSIASEANELVGKARERSIGREEMQSGTFTITNFGAIGGEYATPIINYPETAILGLGAIKKRPWVVEDERSESSESASGEAVSGEVVPRHVMTLSLSIDHRVIDGAEAARFTNTLKEYLQDPTLLLLE
ncbi:dihydrolipoamide acetyltransferase family protein [Halorientalis regularis]|uniref:Pyruvate dehydrogenase E2 component (Dihydrolipoamide acetyltransferase) n=1 Tax=Halorientalis regularis TaxID=660518 RepID=A0A1G7H3K5_9EURY|nr:dihydrolipoamide acetyltransferase family protein [Halorientalis regularis]SDE94945.1 pyruvate dehydrogenase E2 component (dihydrolipoamide acetyltransferase) [Halorientalis regularis]